MAKNVRNRIVQAALAVFQDSDPLTTRQLHYQLAASGDVDNTQAGYKAMADHLSKARLDGEFPAGLVWDPSMDPNYRPGGWDMVWVEKEATLAAADEVAVSAGMGLICTSGPPSITILDHYLQALVDLSDLPETPKRAARIFLLTDWDNTGRMLRTVIPRHLRRLVEVRGLPIAKPEVVEVGLDAAQVRQMSLPSRYGEEVQWELEALTSSQVQDLLNDAITESNR